MIISLTPTGVVVSWIICFAIGVLVGKVF